MTETLSDFHEAKVVRPKQNIDTPDLSKPIQQESNASTFEDTINQDQDLGSSSEDIVTSIDDPHHGLSNVETGILSACGILVVAGIAVGILVWKNSSERRNLRRKHEFSISDIEHNDDQERDICFKIIKEPYKDPGLKLPSILYDQHDFITNWQRKDISHHHSTEPNQNSPTRLISDKAPATLLSDLTKFQIPTLKHTLFSSEEDGIVPQSNKIRINMEEQHISPDNSPEEEKESYILSRNSNYSLMFANSLQIQTNQAGRPSALDPMYDPTALTYPLKKFLRETSTLTESLSVTQIALHLHSDYDDEEEDDNSSVPSKREPTRELSHQLTKLLQQSEQHTTIQVDLNDDKSRIATLSNLQKAYQELEHERKAVYDQERSEGMGPASVFTEDYKQAYFKEYGRQFMSSLDLPDDQYIPLRNASGPELISRAEVLADPIRRLGQDEIALWEENCKRRELKRLSYEMWDEQILRDRLEEEDRRRMLHE